MDRAREVWGGQWLEYLLQDVRIAARSLRKSPGYTASVVLTLALGLGAVATMLAVVDSVLVRPVPIPHPHELVILYGKTDQEGARGELSYSQIQELQRSAHLFSDVAGYLTMTKPVGTSEGTRWAEAVSVTPGFFRMLDVHAAAGHLWDNRATAPVAVISHDFWEERLNASPHALGAVIHLDGEARTIIGILPEGVSVPYGTRAPVVYTLFAPGAKTRNQLLPRMWFRSAFVMARMKPGVTRLQALAEARGILSNLKDEHGVKGSHLALQSYATYLTGPPEKPLLVLLGGVLILLLIACANAANLQIARATTASSVPASSAPAESIFWRAGDSPPRTIRVRRWWRSSIRLS